MKVVNILMKFSSELLLEQASTLPQSLHLRAE